jgi:hypothetical protein
MRPNVLADAESDTTIEWRCRELVELIDALRCHSCPHLNDCNELNGCELASQLIFVAGNLRGRLSTRMRSCPAL